LKNANLDPNPNRNPHLDLNPNLNRNPNRTRNWNCYLQFPKSLSCLKQNLFISFITPSNPKMKVDIHMRALKSCQFKLILIVIWSHLISFHFVFLIAYLSHLVWYCFSWSHFILSHRNFSDRILFDLIWSYLILFDRIKRNQINQIVFEMRIFRFWFENWCISF
jgi:hypothetical protein